jgi:hydroxymethylpyrimidine/phosphomethylpyrimidine kinase
VRLKGRVLVVAGSDSSGGAGIQADIKATLAMGAYASTAISALTAQDTRGVRGIQLVPADFLRLQIEMALEDPGADAVKTGMLPDAAAVDVVADALEGRTLPLVVDPVMVAKGGAALAEGDAVGRLCARLLPRATLLTPNLPEAEVLTGIEVSDVAAMPRVAEALLRMGPAAVLLKGGHLPGDTVVDVLATAEGMTRFVARRIDTRHTHGTGCTLASAIAAGLAQGRPLAVSVERAIAYVRAAIASAPGFGIGHGPLNHAAMLTADS